MKKAVLFARVSTKRQEEEGLSLENIQIPRLEEYAQENGLEVVEKFVFQESADRKIRKRFTEVMEYMKKHDDVEAIIAFRVDRITREEYQDLSERYSKKQKEFERKLANLLDTNKDYYDTACDILDLASRAYELYLGSELDEKREILNLLFQNLYLKDENLVYELNKPFNSILVCNDQHDWLRDQDSNLEPDD